MSYGVQAYAVNVDQVEKVFGSADAELKKLILSEIQDEMSRLDEQLGGTSMTAIADDFFAGEIRFRNEAHKYWYFAEMLCIGYGRMLPNDEWYPFRGATAPWYDYSQFELYGLKISPFLPSPDDFPAVFIVRSENLDEAYAIIYDQYKKETYSCSQTQQFHDGVEDAQKDMWDLALFYY